MLNERPALPYKTNTDVDSGRHRLCLRRRIKFNSSYVRPFFYQCYTTIFNVYNFGSQSNMWLLQESHRMWHALSSLLLPLSRPKLSQKTVVQRQRDHWDWRWVDVNGIPALSLASRVAWKQSLKIFDSYFLSVKWVINAYLKNSLVFSKATVIKALKSQRRSVSLLSSLRALFFD